MKTEGLARQQVLREMMDLAMGRANDAVKLAYLDQDGLGQIDGLDLRCLTEFKRSSNGAVEVKLTDRVAVLEKLLEQQKAEEDGLGPSWRPWTGRRPRRGCVPSGETAIFGQAEAGPGVVEPGLPPPGPGRHCVRRGGAQREDPVPGAVSVSGKEREPWHIPMRR